MPPIPAQKSRSPSQETFASMPAIHNKNAWSNGPPKSVELVQRSGVGWHHAGVEASDREALESLFRAGALRALVAPQPYPNLVLEQMVGRAGRPQYDTCGTAVIMTKSSLKEEYEAQGQSVLESSLLRSGLAEHLNAELVLGSLPQPNLSGCLAWIRETIPLRFPPGLPRSSVEEAMHALCREAVEALCAAGLVDEDSDTSRLRPTGVWFSLEGERNFA
ncbi:hypothetical protein MRX96_028035 [Rhipicephalus microplus]